MSSSRAGGGSGSAAIPANARKQVQSLKEVTGNNSDDEIYAALKECNMDVNEAVQRLLNQDPFHEVKRKRDKKKEWNKETNDGKVRAANGGAQTRGGRGGNLDRASGRGGPTARHPPHDFNGGRGKPGFAKENGNVYPSSRAGNTLGSPSLSSVPSRGQGKSHPSGMSNHSVPAATNATPPPAPQNGSPGFVRPASVPHSSWGASASGHATMADIVKANGSPHPAPGLTPVVSSSSVGPSSSATSAPQQFMIPGNDSPPAPSGVYSSSTDPVLHPSLDSRASGSAGAIKREIGTVGNQRTAKGDWASSSLTMDALSSSAMSSQSLQSSTSAVSASLDGDPQVARPSTPPVSVSPPVLQDRPASHSVDPGSAVGIQARHGVGSSSSVAPGPRSPVVPFSSRPAYAQHPVGTQKASGAGLEWKPKLVAQSAVNLGGLNNTPSPPEVVRPPSPPTVSGDSGIVSATSSKLQGVNIHSDPSVKIPNHLQVGEEEQTHLSFGSFAAGFGTAFAPSFVPEDSNKSTTPVVETPSVIETPVEQSNPSGVVNPAPAALGQSYVHQSISVPEEVLSVTDDIAHVSLAPPTISQSDVSKPEAVIHPGPHYPYLPTIPNYPAFNVLQQVPVGQYTYDAAETPQSQPSDVARLPSLVPYTDPAAASYYTPLFRPGSDGDTRYSPFVTSNVSNKYNGNVGLFNLAGQSPASQESGNSELPQVVNAQMSHTGKPALPTMPQQPLPLHAYPGQPGGGPIGPHYANVFGYQFIPSSYPYMHPHGPYPHNFPASSVYPQGPPTASNYPTAAPSTYPPGGPTPVKYQLSQYKTGNATGITPHSAAAGGYGGYGAPPSGYASNPTVTVGSTAGYEDVGVQQQYKDNNLYIPGQQEGSTVWIQAPLSRDMAVQGMQASSYYNLPSQGQHGGYAHTQQASHAHTHPGAYQSMYHPSQAAQAPTAHQTIQQPQALGAGGGSQAGGYQQPQRTQQNWTNNY